MRTTVYRPDELLTQTHIRAADEGKSQSSATVQRYIEHRSRGTSVHLFLRARRVLPHGVTSPYVFAGPIAYRSHEGNRPVSFTWKLESLMPEALFEVARSVAA